RLPADPGRGPPRHGRALEPRPPRCVRPGGPRARRWPGDVRDLPAPAVRLGALAHAGAPAVHAPPDTALAAAPGVPVPVRPAVVPALVVEHARAVRGAAARARDRPASEHGAVALLPGRLGADRADGVRALGLDAAMAATGRGRPLLARRRPARRPLADRPV